MKISMGHGALSYFPSTLDYDYSVVKATIIISGKELHDPAENHNPNVFEGLQNQIIDVNAIDNDGCTLLHVAAEYGHVSTIQFLLERGADVNVATEKGRTPLHCTIWRYPENIECVEMLLQYGADVQIAQQLQFPNRQFTVIDAAENCRHFYSIQPVLAHVAMLETTGIFVGKEIKSRIDSVVQFKHSFDTYKQQLEQFKNVVICDSVTMFQLLTVSEKQLIIYLRNEHLVSELEKGAYKHNEIYYRKLRLRIDCAYRKVHKKERAVEALCKIMQFSYNTHPTITDEICSYLNKQDFVLLGQI